MGDLIQPWHFVVLGLFVGVCIFLLPMIFYLLTLQKALSKCTPGFRSPDPGMVWLLLIPVFNLIWQFIVVTGIGKSLASEYARRGIPSPEPFPGQSIGLAMCICSCCCIIPILGILAGLAYLVLWIIYWIKIAEFSRVLDMPPVPVAAPPAI